MFNKKRKTISVNEYTRLDKNEKIDKDIILLLLKNGKENQIDQSRKM